jgi:sugar phosphate isomerase/epimerase
MTEMKIGMVADSLGSFPLDSLLDTAVELGIQMLEFPCGNWSSAPHVQLDTLLDDPEQRQRFLGSLQERGLTISALNCSGNQLAPGNAGKAHDAVVRKTIRLAGLLGVKRIVMMSGLPAGKGDQHPNWITVAWPPETTRLLEYQWEEVALPYWRELVSYAADQGVEKICIEPHGHQLVYNVPTLLRLREAVGTMVGANFDPSHMMWMGGDPLAAIRALGAAIYHVHAKDTRVDPYHSAMNTRLETRTNQQVSERAWNYVTLGYGHGESWWRDFVLLLRQVGYNDVLSIEHEDMSMSPLEGVRKTVTFLQGIIEQD